MANITYDVIVKRGETVLMYDNILSWEFAMTYIKTALKAFANCYIIINEVDGDVEPVDNPYLEE